MKWFNIIGGILCAVLIFAGQRGGNLPLPIPHVIVEPPLIDGDGLYVLVIEEKDDRPTLPIKQASVLVPSSQIKGWLSDHSAQWRILDANDQDMRNEDEKWNTALKEAKPDKLPWIYIQNNRKRLFAGPLPGSVEDTIALFDKYAPAGSAE